MTEVVAALIWEGERFLACQRPAHKARGLLWEFVGGKNRWGESVEETLRREWMEELNLSVDVKDHLLDTEFIYNNTHFTLVCHRVEITGGDIKLSVHQDYKWVDKKGLCELEFGDSDSTIKDWIISNL